MNLLGNLARGYLLNRLLGRRRPPPGYPHSGPGYGYPQPSGYGRRHPNAYDRRGRVGLFEPFPYYSRRTRGGARVSVGGCCLPIPLFVLGSTMTAAALGTRRALRRD